MTSCTHLVEELPFTSIAAPLSSNSTSPASEPDWTTSVALWALPALAAPCIPTHWLELSPLLETSNDWLMHRSRLPARTPSTDPLRAPPHRAQAPLRQARAPRPLRNPTPRRARPRSPDPGTRIRACANRRGAYYPTPITTSPNPLPTEERDAQSRTPLL